MYNLKESKIYYDVKNNKPNAGFRKGVVFAVYKNRTAGNFEGVKLFTDKVEADKYRREHFNHKVETLFYNPT